MKPIACVGAVVSDGSDRIVVVRRGRPPSKGLWSIPGGRVEPGETLAAAVRREVYEETGLDVDVLDIIGRIDIAHGDVVYDVTDFAVRLTAASGPPDPVAGDDATDARWVTYSELTELDTTPGLAETLRGWGVWA